MKNIRQTDSWKRAHLSVLQVVAKGETKKIRELRKCLDKETDAAEISSLISAIHALEEYMEKGKAAREKRKKDKADKLKAAPPPETVVEAAPYDVDAFDSYEKKEFNITLKVSPEDIALLAPLLENDKKVELFNGDDTSDPRANAHFTLHDGMLYVSVQGFHDLTLADAKEMVINFLEQAGVSPAAADSSAIDNDDVEGDVAASASPKKPSNNEKPPVADVCDDCGADIGSCGCKNMAHAADGDPGQMAELVALVVSQVESYRANHADNQPLESVLDKILQEVRQETLDTAGNNVWDLQHPGETPEA